MSGKLKEVKTRIGSVKNTQKITKAMKLVAASKFKKAIDAIGQMRPYSDKLLEMLQNIVAATEGEIKLDLAEQRAEINNVLVIVLTSDKGLCGSYNANLIKQAKQLVKDYSNTNTNVSVMTIGKKGNDVFKRMKNLTVNDDYVNLFKDLHFDNVLEAINGVMDAYRAGEYDKVHVVYSHFVNAVTQDFNSVQFLPIEKIEPKIKEGEEKVAGVDYIFEPEKNELIQELAPKILKTQFYSYLLDNNASEHGARMTAMENATENANELLKDLQITYNKERQAAITKELIEIVSGAAALGN